MPELKEQKLFALIDPNWGEPIPVLDTLSTNLKECLYKIRKSKDCQLHGGGSEYPLPDGTDNNLERLREFGYRVGYVNVIVADFKDITDTE